MEIGDKMEDIKYVPLMDEAEQVFAEQGQAVLDAAVSSRNAANGQCEELVLQTIGSMHRRYGNAEGREGASEVGGVVTADDPLRSM